MYAHLLSQLRTQTRRSQTPVEVWEDPQLRFRWTAEAIDRYALDGRWELAFNALVLPVSPLHSA